MKHIVEEWAERYPDIYFIYRSHRGQKRKAFDMSSYKNISVSDRDHADIFDSIAAADLILTPISTVTIDASRLQKPVIVFDMENSEFSALVEPLTCEKSLESCEVYLQKDLSSLQEKGAIFAEKMLSTKDSAKKACSYIEDML